MSRHVILLVEDNPDASAALEGLLGEAGGDADQAVAKIKDALG